MLLMNSYTLQKISLFLSKDKVYSSSFVVVFVIVESAVIRRKSSMTSRWAMYKGRCKR